MPFFLLISLLTCFSLAHGSDEDGNSTWTLTNSSVVVTVVTTVTSSVSDPRCSSNCTFSAPFISSANLAKFPKNCSTVCGFPLFIGNGTDLTDKQLTNAFKNMKHFIGDLIVDRSKFKSGRFLPSLETIDCDNTGFFQWTLNDILVEIGLPNLTTVACRINISSNKKLTNLNLPKMVPTPSLTANYTRISLAIYDNAPDLCITTQEMTNLIANENVDIGPLPQKYCQIPASSNSTSKTCTFENSTLTSMDSGCIQIRGDIVIGADEEAHTPKLMSVKNIFGSLTIDGTNLTSLDFLDGLEQVVTLKENGTAILVQYNSNLVNVSFPSLKKVYSNIPESIVFQNNSEEMVTDPNICFRIRTVLNTSSVDVPTIDGMQCEQIEENSVVKDKSGNKMFTILQTVILVLTITIVF